MNIKFGSISAISGCMKTDCKLFIFSLSMCVFPSIKMTLLLCIWMSVIAILSAVWERKALVWFWTKILRSNDTGPLLALASVWYSSLQRVFILCHLSLLFFLWASILPVTSTLCSPFSTWSWRITGPYLKLWVWKPRRATLLSQGISQKQQIIALFFNFYAYVTCML